MLTIITVGVALQRLRALAMRWTSGRGESLRDLDDHTLADIGVHRSEITSIEAEWLGRSDTTRLRIAVGAG
jgi:uncharacterized protein YjiS (DUF1127 family)